MLLATASTALIMESLLAYRDGIHNDYDGIQFDHALRFLCEWR